MALSTIGTNGIADSAVTAAKATGFGKIGQIIQTNTSTSLSSSSDSYVDLSGFTFN